MSINDLRARLHDVPAIETLTMRQLLGRNVYGFGGLIAATDPGASPQEIEDAIRLAASLPRSTYPTDDATLTTPLPIVNLTEAKPMSEPKPTGFVPGEISGLFKALRARKDAMVADLMATGADVEATIQSGEKMTAALKAEGEALKAEFATLTNNSPA